MSFRYRWTRDDEQQELWDLNNFPVEFLEEMVRMWNRVHPEKKVRVIN